MEKITDYKIEVAAGYSHLQHKVNDAIKEGWQPLGGITAVEMHFPQLGADNVETFWGQALVKFT